MTVQKTTTFLGKEIGSATTLQTGDKKGLGAEEQLFGVFVDKSTLEVTGPDSVVVHVDHRVCMRTELQIEEHYFENAINTLQSQGLFGFREQYRWIPSEPQVEQKAHPLQKSEARARRAESPIRYKKHKHRR